jgi:hypothetical protein
VNMISYVDDHFTPLGSGHCADGEQEREVSCSVVPSRIPVFVESVCGSLETALVNPFLQGDSAVLK